MMASNVSRRWGRRVSAALGVVTLGLVLPAAGETAHGGDGSGHAAHATGHDDGVSTMVEAPLRTSMPTLAGEYAFATISEIAGILRDDPDTDWSRVDLAALREHLVDMQHVTIAADVVAEPIEGGARFVVMSDDDAVADSIRRMTAAHSVVMASNDATTAWRYSQESTTHGAIVTVLSDSPDDVSMIRGLGFHGLMADGDHHRAHHWMIATGVDPH